MKLGTILQSNNPEHVWNTLRLGITALSASHSVHIFLMSEGVEITNIPDTKHFDISKKLEKFQKLGGQLLACGTCLEIRHTGENRVCPVSTMKDLVKMIEESDKVLVFG
ncbi:MAG TPA: DsrE family protein [Patescibacteria group bacterium]|nr:DsrE family protein [Patescibacteria group bacterium]